MDRGRGRVIDTAHMTPGLVFNCDAHTYHLDGRRLPSVTEILTACRILDFDGIPPDTLEYARQRGVAVHHAIRLLFEGTLDPRTVRPELEPYLFAFEKFRIATSCVPVMFETPLAHARLGFAGCPDLVCTLYDEPTIVVPDFKAVATLDRGYGVQTAGYKLLLRENGHDVRRRYVVQLKGDGTFKLEEHTDAQDEAEFRSALFILARRHARNGGYA